VFLPFHGVGPGHAKRQIDTEDGISMSLLGGFAAVISVDQAVLDGALKAIRPTIENLNRITRLDPTLTITHDVYLEEPFVTVVDGLIKVRLRAWGEISYRAGNGVVERRRTMWVFDLRCAPSASIARDTADLSVASLVVELANWTINDLAISVLSGPAFSDEALSEIDKYSRLLTFLLGGISGFLPPISLELLGGLARHPSATATLALVNGTAMIGIDVSTPTFTTSGAASDLVALPDDIGVVFHPNALPLVFDQIEAGIRSKAADDGATLNDFVVVAVDGAIRISGVLAKAGGSVSFSFDAVPHITNDRFWFEAERIETDGHLEWWAILLGIATVGVGIAIGELQLLWATAMFNFGLTSVGPRSTIRRRELIIVPGAAPVEIAVNQVELSAEQVIFGMTFSPKPPGAVVYAFGSVSVGGSADFAMNLPWGLSIPVDPESTADGRSLADPLLRVRWTLRRVDTGRVIFVEDGLASGRLTRSVGGLELPLTETDSYSLHVRVYLCPLDSLSARTNGRGTSRRFASRDRSTDPRAGVGDSSNTPNASLSHAVSH
jgi:hypothetical protein